MIQPAFIPRFIQERVEEALADTPVVLIHGPRQSGKTTLARHVGQEKGFAYYSFDDVGVRSAAQDDRGVRGGDCRESHQLIIL
jgi:predicted AAA+ superfamily ATPase